MSKKAVVANFGIASYFLCGLFLFTPERDAVPEGFKLSGKGSLSWDESTRTLTVYQETSGILTISEPVIPKIVQRTKGKGNHLILKIDNGNPTSITGKLTAPANVMIINPNGIHVAADGIIDVPGPITFSNLDVDLDGFAQGGDNRFRGNGTTTDFGEIEVDGEDVILLGRFVQKVAMGAGGDLIIHDKVEKTTTFEFKELEDIK